LTDASLADRERNAGFRSNRSAHAVPGFAV